MVTAGNAQSQGRRQRSVYIILFGAIWEGCRGKEVMTGGDGWEMILGPQTRTATRKRERHGQGIDQAGSAGTEGATPLTSSSGAVGSRADTRLPVFASTDGDDSKSCVVKLSLGSSAQISRCRVRAAGPSSSCISLGDGDPHDPGDRAMGWHVRPWTSAMS